jgi:hypothetical protein
MGWFWTQVKIYYLFEIENPANPALECNVRHLSVYKLTSFIVSSRCWLVELSRSGLFIYIVLSLDLEVKTTNGITQAIINYS